MQAVPSGRRLFVSGHDPERDGRLVYRGWAGQAVPIARTGDALRLATLNALASARAASGSPERLRCVVLTAFVSTATPAGLDPKLLRRSLATVATVLGDATRPAVWLRPAQGLAGGMTVEVELLLELRGGNTRRRSPRSSVTPRRRGRPRGRGGPEGARARRRSAARTS